MSESQNSLRLWVGEYNLLSELFVFTGNPLSTSRKHSLKCRGQGEVIHTLNLERKEKARFWFVFSGSPEGTRSKFEKEGGKG